MSTETNQETIAALMKLLEPDAIASAPQALLAASIAISLRRIADKLEAGTPPKVLHR